MKKTVKNCTTCNQIGQERCPEHVNTDHFSKKLWEFEHSDNVIKLDFNCYTTQCSQYNKKMTFEELACYFYKEYYHLDYPDKRCELIIRPEKITIKNAPTESQEDIDCRESLYNQYIQEYSYIGELPISDDMKQRIITDMIKVGDDAYEDGRKQASDDANEAALMAYHGARPKHKQ